MSPGACKRYSRTPLSCTTDKDSASAFETLITLGADINAVDVQFVYIGNELSILHQISLYNCLNVMSLVLNYRWGDLESRSENGHMALHIAAIGSNLWMVRKLVEAGANISAMDGHGATPLDHMAHHAEYESDSTYQLNCLL
jgi:ankyrin repeat protein